jgi:predicted AlkP superfamily pyrophosphatase or phosphodiesterase
MLGGIKPDAVYWFDDANGRFVTSTYYEDSLPGWVSSYDCFPFREKAIRDGWRKGWPEKTYALATPDDSPVENDSAQSTFPHLYDSTSAVARTPSEWLLETPYSDEMVLDFARALIAAEGLGQDSIPDLLCISLSATDYIGHSFGPHSQEVLDGLLRADSGLAQLFDAVDRLVGVNQYTVALSSDHGVMPLPEEAAGEDEYAERILRADCTQQYEAAARQIADQVGILQPLIIGQVNGLMLDTKAGEERGVRGPDLRKAVAEALGKIDYVEEAMTYEDLISPDGPTRGYSAMYRRSFHPDRTPDIVIQTKRNVLILGSRFGTTHGTPYDYDTHVPLIFWGQGVTIGSDPRTDRVRTVDLAPTMAVLLGLTPPVNIDGVVLHDAIAERAH